MYYSIVFIKYDDKDVVVRAYLVYMTQHIVSINIQAVIIINVTLGSGRQYNSHYLSVLSHLDGFFSMGLRKII